VDAGKYPDQVEVPLDEPFVNANGTIQNLVLENFTSAALIRSAAGAIRANHFHKTDWHYSYVVEGEIWYYWRPVGSNETASQARFRAGQMFFTPPLVEHAMFFPEDSVFLTFARNVRDHEHHESDVVRVELITASPDQRGERGWTIHVAQSRG
jgi:dTDP-4-dehydrorhamnose 3,5-epimerase-like enzyme